MDAVPCFAAAVIHQQAAQPREHLDHHLCRAGAGPHDRHAPALFGKRKIRFRIGLSYSDISFSRIAGGDVSFTDEQCRRHHPRPANAPARAQSRCAIAVLHLRKDVLVVGFRIDPMRALRLHRQLHPRDSRHVLGPSRVDVYDRDRQSCPRSARFINGFRCQNRGQHCAAGPDSADSDERRAY